MAVGVERITVNLPNGFDPVKHQGQLLKKVGEMYGTGFEIDSIDRGAMTAVVSRQVEITEVTQSEQKTDEFEVRLARGTKPADGDKVEAKLTDANPGYYMTRFEPFLGKATLTRLSDDEARCRGAVAVAIGVKPWDVRVKKMPDGGYELELPRTYVRSKHDSRLDEVATTVVGREGWYVDVDAQRLTARIVPSEPPTFPEGIAFPLNRLGKGDVDVVPFGRILPEPGKDSGPEIAIDWTASAWALVAGTPGSGKSVTLNAIIADALSNGSELCVVDDMSKAVDFEWCKPFCRPGGWGCDSLEAGVAALGLVREEGAKRAAILKQMGINNWLDMPRGKRFTPILVIVDEVSALVVPDKMPVGIPKTHSLFIETAERNLARAMLQSFMRKTIAELRFVGVRMVLSTQATNANTGVDPGMRTLIGHKVLQGVNPSKSARSQIFADESAVPQVPENVKAGGKRAKGVGVATLEGQAPLIYKSYFAPTSDYQKALTALGVKTTRSPEPTQSQMDRFLPKLEDEADGRPAVRGGGPERAPSGRPASEVLREMGDTEALALMDATSGMSSYERANAVRHAAANPGGQTRKQKAHAAEEAGWAAQSGPVTVTTPSSPAAPASDDW